MKIAIQATTTFAVIVLSTLWAGRRDATGAPAADSQPLPPVAVIGLHNEAVDELDKGSADFDGERYADAVKHLRRAFELSSLEGTDEAAMALAINSRYLLAKALWLDRKLPEAETELRPTVGTARLVLRDEPATLSKMIGSLAGLRLELQDNASAIALGEESYHMAKDSKNPDPIQLAQYSFFAGMGHYRLRHAGEAETWLRRALQIYDEHPPSTDDSVTRALAARYFATLMWNAKRFCEAQRNFALALSLPLPGLGANEIDDMRARIHDIAEYKMCEAEEKRTKAHPAPRS